MYVKYMRTVVQQQSCGPVAITHQQRGAAGAGAPLHLLRRGGARHETETVVSEPWQHRWCSHWLGAVV